MSDVALRGVVVAHGALASALVAAVEEITGVRDVLVAVSNRGCDRDTLEARLREAAGSGPAVVFVDLQSGSCFFAAMHSLGALPGMRVVTGVNLPMLVDFIFHREAGLEAAVARARDVGEKAIEGRR
jgi:N-acetylgalactosamine PTS system EIIA component